MDTLMDGLTLEPREGLTTAPHEGDFTVGFWLALANDESADPMRRATAFIMLLQKHANMTVVLDG